MKNYKMAKYININDKILVNLLSNCPQIVMVASVNPNVSEDYIELLVVPNFLDDYNKFECIEVMARKNHILYVENEKEEK